MVSEICYPEKNEYFESTSADGYAFLGYARSTLGLNATYCREAIRERNYTLNAEQRIKATGITVPKTNMYVYTIWPCVEFLQLSEEHDIIKDLIHIVDEIGTYKNSMVRYCSHEIGYVVPNVTSAAALLYAMAGQSDRSAALIDVLRSRQAQGNWYYEIWPSAKKYRMEDPYHLAMMVYHLRQVQRLADIDLSDIICNSLPILQRLNTKRLQKGSLGWGIPMLYAATLGLDNGLAYRALSAMMGRNGLWHKNFRVRAISAWALVKGHEFLQEEKEI